MNIFKKLEKISPPYSTIIALITTILIGVIVIFARAGELTLLGIGIILGACITIFVKKALEVSDKKTLGGFAKLFQGKNETKH